MNVEEVIKTQKALPLGGKTIIHLQLVTNKVLESVGNALKPYDVSLQQFNVLRILRGQKGNPANLNDPTNHASTGITHLAINR